MDIYREQLLDHYRNPRGWGLKEGADFTYELYNQLCGDTLTVQLWVNNDSIAEMRFFGVGCAISRACTSLVAESVKDKNISHLQAMKLSDIEALLGEKVSPGRISCALLGLSAAQHALL